MAFFSPLGGTVADRLSRKWLVMVTWGGVAAVFAAIGILILTQQVQLWHLVAASLVNGALFSFNIPARFALISQIVEDRQLMGAMALFSSTFNLSGVVFPLIAGAVVDGIGAGAAYFLISAAYLFAVAVIAWLSPPRALPARKYGNVLREFLAGVRFVSTDAVVRWLVLLALVAVVLGQAYAVLLPGFAAGTLGVSAQGLGFLFTAFGLGALVGNVLLGNLCSGAPLGGWMVILGIASGFALILLAMVRSLYPAMAVLFLLGLTGPPFSTINQTLVQLRAPPEFRGRVQSIYMLTFAAQPLGAMPLAALGDRVGLTVSFLVAGASTLFIFVLVAWWCKWLLQLPSVASPVAGHR